MRRRAPVATTIAICAALLLPALAHADALARVTDVYRSTGAIPACRFSAATLSRALAEEGPDDAQYFQDLTNAIQSALNAQAGGRCGQQRAGTTIPGGAVSLPGSGPGGSPPRSVTASTSAGVPFPFVLLGAFAVLLLLAGGLFALGSSTAEPLWLADWRHAFAEAGYRLSGRWRQLSDRR